MKPIICGPKMNSLELAYATQLELLKQAGEIVDYRVHPMGLRLADKTFYHPDFLVVYKDRFEFHETKGWMRDDANVKLKVAADQFPWFGFVLVKKVSKARGVWEYKKYGRGGE